MLGIGGKLPGCPLFFLPAGAAAEMGLLGAAPGALDPDEAAAGGAAWGSPHWEKATGALGTGAGAVAGLPCD